MNFAIVGCGFTAKKHAAAINRIPEAKMAAVCDMDESAMEQYKEYGAKAYTNYNEMLADDDIDAVCICTPACSHTMLVEQAAASKKHIVLEQPMALTLDETERIVEVCRNNDVKLTVVQPVRFRPVVMELRKIIDAGLLGNISHASARINLNRNMDFCKESLSRGAKQHEAGGVMGQAIDYLDLLLWFMGQPDEVFSMAATGFMNMEAEQVAAGLIRFESGAIGTIETSTAVYYRNFEESITIFGEKGTVKIGGPKALSFEHFNIKGLSETETETIMEKVKSDPWGIPGHEQTISDLIQSIKENREPLVTGEDGKSALELVQAFYESARTNSPIGMKRGVLI
ncbi:gfo/Idh/MocA family oxidoreductase [Neobacillus piezotolerans]|uniref:Gfo/Idh/MocA family oxidoreductase n=1 Tax=Neobacillus piezotolerans TaxID=2259171 RepID=A0A3D8GMI9_9BACI|nr:Gfo/Idh/MocA family oxidoreductase [Neobacillus piezotolerans]RDU35618.1 gfo/Idh/MocA family oxidoreductase [Neobacillus piezotolerans]